jgi:hypothetical protein
MAMATVIWAAAAEVIIMDGAEDAAITTAGHEVIVTITDTAAGEHLAVNSGAIGVAAGPRNSTDRARTAASCQ